MIRARTQSVVTAASSPQPRAVVEMVPHGRSHSDQSGTVEGLGRLARRLVHHVLAVVLELRSRRESVWGLRTGVSAMCRRGPHTNVRDGGAVMPGAHLPELGPLAVASGGGRMVACHWEEPRSWPRGRACDLHLSPVVSGG